MHLYASPATKHLQFIERLSHFGISRTPIATLAIGKALADRLPLPPPSALEIPLSNGLNTAYRDAPSSYFRYSLETAIRQQLSTLNEYAVLDFEAVVDSVRSFYGLRCTMAYPAQLVPMTAAGVDESALLGFFGMYRHISPSTLTLIGENGQKIAQLYTEATAFFSDVVSKPNSAG